MKRCDNSLCDRLVPDAFPTVTIATTRGTFRGKQWSFSYALDRVLLEAARLSLRELWGMIRRDLARRIERELNSFVTT